jgi:hypothetical protein
MLKTLRRKLNQRYGWLIDPLFAIAFGVMLGTMLGMFAGWRAW